jgi:hypothetical protein
MCALDNVHLGAEVFARTRETIRFRNKICEVLWRALRPHEASDIAIYFASPIPKAPSMATGISWRWEEPFI